MSKIITIIRNNEFRRLYRTQSTVSRALVTYRSKNRLGLNRIGITATKKIGKAHERNRARRVIKEAYRIVEPDLKAGYDIVFVARTKTCNCRMQEVLGAMRQHLDSLILKKDL